MARRGRAGCRGATSARDRESRPDDVGEALGRGKTLELGRCEPMGFRQLLVEHDVAGNPARREGQNNEVALDLVVAVARDHLAMAGEPERLDVERGLLAYLADDRLVQGFARLDAAARQREQTARRRSRAGPAQHLARAE